MLKSLFLFIFTLSTVYAFPQTKKNNVIVYGDNEAAWAAAVQSSRSGVNTLWLRQKKNIGTTFFENKSVEVKAYKALNTGLWAEFLALSNSQVLSDSAFSSQVTQAINPQLARNALTSITDSIQNLQQLFNVEIKSIKKSGDQWQVELSNNIKLKVNAVVDASENGDLMSFIALEDLRTQPSSDEKLIPMDQLYGNPRYRTSLFTLNQHEKFMAVPSTAVLSTPAENIFVLNSTSWMVKENLSSPDAIPLLFNTGQVLGASAAYCAFFKTTTEKINIRTLQGELLAYKGQLIPFLDVPPKDPHFLAIQRIGATGIMVGQFDESTSGITFQPEKKVSTKEIESVLTTLYTRSQIWFLDHKIQELTLKEVLSLLKFTALRGEELDADVKEGWDKRFGFSGEYELSNPITRKQLAVLLDYYLKPFNVKVDSSGAFKQ